MSRRLFKRLRFGRNTSNASSKRTQKGLPYEDSVRSDVKGGGAVLIPG